MFGQEGGARFFTHQVEAQSLLEAKIKSPPKKKKPCSPFFQMRVCIPDLLCKFIIVKNSRI